MSAATRGRLLERGLRLEYLTVGWNIAEGLVAVGAGVLAGSIALIGFGVDSFVETISGFVLIWRLRAEAFGGADEERIERVEQRARRLVAISFLVLAGYVAFEAVRTLAAQDQPDASPMGIALTAVSLVVMLWLARAKRVTGEALRSRALIADSHQTFACWYLSATTLAGLALNAALGLWWADPIAALVIAVILLREAREAWRGEDDDA
ncbi:MAG TPA: cation transporter [Candidatus Limnocylindrales bacterium]|nr:cation transporter [Candidatus Limnocylindrales bacterium]